MRKDIGHIYVVQLADGLVKVGKTINPKYRISKTNFGHRDIIDYWVSVQFVGYSKAEYELIAFMNDVGILKLGKEYFSGVSFTDAVAKASSLVVDSSPDAIQKQNNIDHEAFDLLAKKLVRMIRPSGYDEQWVNHVKSYSSVVSIIESAMLKEGVSGYMLDSVDSLGGISLLHLSMLLVSYRIEGDKIDYFNDILSSLYEVIANDSECVCDWAAVFMSDMDSEMKVHYSDVFNSLGKPTG